MSHRSAEELEKEEKVSAKEWPIDSSFPYHAQRRPIPNTAKPARDSATFINRPISPPTAEENPLNKVLEDEASWNKAWKDIVTRRPVFAILCLQTLERRRWGRLEAEDVNALFRRLDRSTDYDRHLAAKVSPHVAEAVLIRVRDRLVSLSPKVRNGESQSTTRFRGSLLFGFLSTCVFLNAHELAIKAFIEYVPRQLRQGICKMVKVEHFADSLRQHRNWHLMTDCIVHEAFPTRRTPHLPMAIWTPKLFKLVGEAYLAQLTPGSVAVLSQLYREAERPMTPGVLAIMLRAAVAVGDEAQVVSLRKEMRDHSRNAEEYHFQEQNAIVSGQRFHGLDVELEKQILAGISKHQPRDAARLLHRLIRLRLDENDLQGAMTLLNRFNLDSSESKPDALRPTSSTIQLAFEIVSRRPDRQQLEAWWIWFVNNPTNLKGEMISLLVQTMSEVGLVAEAYEMIRSALFNFDPPSKVWRLPLPTAIDHDIANTLTSCMAKHQGLDGLQRATDLMRQANIMPNGKTLQIILDAVRRHMAADPEELGRLLNLMLERATNVRAQIGHIDSLLAEAVKLASRQPSRHLSTDTVGNLNDPLAGMIPVGKFADACDAILQSLRDRAVPPTSLGIALRIQFESAIGDQIAAVPSAQRVWNELTDSGVQLNKRHLLALTQGYVDAGRIDQAEDVLQLALQMGIRPTRGMHMVLLVGWSKAGHPKRARKAYETIRHAGRKDSTEGLDLVAVTAMVQAYIRDALHHAAAELVHNDLLPFLQGHRGLDDQAVIIGMTALRWTNDEAGAIDLLESRGTPRLSYFLRNCTTTIRTHLRRKILQGLAGLNDHSTLERVERILEADTKARPWITGESLFTRPPGDRVPRWYNRHSLLPRLHSSDQTDQTERIADMISPLSPDTTAMSEANVVDEMEEKMADHRQKLEMELISLRPRETDRSSIYDPVLTNDENELVESEMLLYKKRLAHPNLSSKSGTGKDLKSSNKRHRIKKDAKRAKADSPLTLGRDAPRNILGQVETELASRKAATRRLNVQKDQAVRDNARNSATKWRKALASDKRSAADEKVE